MARGTRCRVPGGIAALLALPFSLAAQDRAMPAGTLEVRERAEVLVGLALREPMLVEHPSGALFAAGYSRAPEEALDPPNLYRSDDGGRGWVQVDVGTAAEGALGNSDVDLVVGPDGALYFLTMGFDRDVGEGTHVALGLSRDVGRTWSWRFISRTRFDDRPWIALSPGGRAHVIWNDGEGVRHATSDDGGLTWTERSRIHPRGGSSHLAVGPRGELAVRITPASASSIRYDEGVDFVAVSLDDGETWELTPPPGDRSWDRDLEEPEDVPRWVEPIGWGPEGELYYLWSEGTELWLGRSDDLGSTWSRTLLVEGSAPVYFPFLAVADGGEIATSWFSGVGDDLRAHVGLVRPGDAGTSIAVTDPLPVDAWRVREGARERDPAGEYFPVAHLSDGDLGAVLPIQASERGEGFSWIRIGASSSMGDEAAIRAARAAQNEAIEDGAFDIVASFWTDDITIRSGLGFTLSGRDAYRAAFSADSSVVYVRTPEDVRVAEGWPLAWEEGTWVGRRRNDGEALISGRYAAQWIEEGGEWRIRSELFVALGCSGTACDWPVIR